MAASGRVIGLILIVVGVVLGVGIGAWLNSGMQEGTLRGSGAIMQYLLRLTRIARAGLRAVAG